MTGDEYAVLVLMTEQRQSFTAANGARVWDFELEPDAFREAALTSAVRSGWKPALDEFIAKTPVETVNRVGLSRIVTDFCRRHPDARPAQPPPVRPDPPDPSDPPAPVHEPQVIESGRAWTAALTEPAGERRFGFAVAGPIDPPPAFVTETLNAVAADGWSVHHVAEDREMDGDEVRLVAVRYLLRRESDAGRGG